MEAEKRNNIAAGIAGILFFTGWWIIIDVTASGLNRHEFNPAYHLCGLCGTIALFIVNSVSKAQLRGDGLEIDGYLYICPIASLLWLFLGFLMAFACCIASFWILIGGYLNHDSIHNKWPGVAILLQNLLIFASSLVFKFGRAEEY